MGNDGPAHTGLRHAAAAEDIVDPQFWLRGQTMLQQPLDGHFLQTAVGVMADIGIAAEVMPHKLRVGHETYRLQRQLHRALGPRMCAADNGHGNPVVQQLLVQEIAVSRGDDDVHLRVQFLVLFQCGGETVATEIQGAADGQRAADCTAGLMDAVAHLS